MVLRFKRKWMSREKSLQSNEILIQGVPASPGVAMGQAFVYRKKAPEVETDRIEKHLASDEVTVFHSAREKLRTEWKQLLKKEDDSESRAIISAQIEIIGDPDLASLVEEFIQNKQHRAQHAIIKAFKRYIDRLADSGNSVMANRMIDLSDIRDQLVEATGTTQPALVSKNGDIVVSEEISPREVIQLSHQNIKGFIMEHGGNTSHAAIIARSVGIPAVVGAKGIMAKIEEDDTVCLDGQLGLVSINPSPHTRKRVEERRARETQTVEDLCKICSKKSITKDGKKFVIRANLEFVEELDNVRQFNAEGVGLLRTESVYLNQEQFGSTQKQASFYSKVLAQTGEAPVTIRLFDVGGDKFQDIKVTESNPFLGWRGIRMLLDECDVLREQLRAILITAEKYPGRVKLLVPMVSSLDEITALKDELNQCREQLQEEGHEMEVNIPLGIMVEIPSVAIQAEYFADEVDFFSIGTNDLTQYILAVDRGNALISRLYNQAHPAMWRLINYVTDVAEAQGLPVDVCGELAAHPAAAACLLGMGVSALSMSPVNIPAVKQLLLQCTEHDFQRLATNVLACKDLEEIETTFSNWKNELG